MNRSIKSVYLPIYAVVIFSINFAACNNNQDKKTEAVAEKSVGEQRLAEAISCTKMGIPVVDSARYMEGGGKEFISSVVNKVESDSKAPEGMVLIPGGEFSMGGVNPVGMMDGGKENMNDARPVKRRRLFD